MFPAANMLTIATKITVLSLKTQIPVMKIVVRPTCGVEETDGIPNTTQKYSKQQQQ